MAIWSLDIQKRLSSEFWTNRYFITANSIALAEAFADDIVAAERGIHSSLVSFVNFRVSDPGESEAYVIVPLGVNGTRDTTDLLPLFNTFRVDLVAAVGRPSRKFYRGVLGEGDINGEAVTLGTWATNFATVMTGLLGDSESDDQIIDPQGTLLTAVALYPFVQMRQLRRGRRKRSNPVFQ